jgi:hypothetical protein
MLATGFTMEKSRGECRASWRNGSNRRAIPMLERSGLDEMGSHTLFFTFRAMDTGRSIIHQTSYYVGRLAIFEKQAGTYDGFCFHDREGEELSARSQN